MQIVINNYALIAINVSICDSKIVSRNMTTQAISRCNAYPLKITITRARDQVGINWRETSGENKESTSLEQPRISGEAARMLKEGRNLVRREKQLICPKPVLGADYDVV